MKHRAALATVAVALMCTACGTNVSRARLAATNNGLPRAPGQTAVADVGAQDSSGAGVASGGADAGLSGPEATGTGATASDAGGEASASPVGASNAATSAGRTAGLAGKRSEIVLGVIGTATGPIGAQLADAPVGVRAWVADVNARGGLNGHPVRVVIADDGGDPAKAAQLAKRMIEQDKVFAFYGLYGATTEQAIAPIVEQQSIPVVGGVQHPIADTSPMFFNPQGGSKATYRGILTTLTTQSRARKVALLYCREADTCPKGAAIIDAYAAKAGVQVVYHGQISLAQPDYTAEVIQARSSGADALVAVIDFSSAIRIIKAAHRQNWRPVFVQSASSYTKGFVTGGGADVDGTLTFGTVPPYGLSPMMQGYRDAVDRYVPGGVLGDFGGQMWVGGKLWERLAPSLGDTPTRSQVLTALYALRGETLGGLTPPLTFPRGAHGDVNLCIVPVRLQGTTWVAPLGDRYLCSP